MSNEKRANIYILYLIFTLSSCSSASCRWSATHTISDQDNKLCRKTEKVRYPTSSLSTLPSQCAFSLVILIGREWIAPTFSQHHILAVYGFSFYIHFSYDTSFKAHFFQRHCFHTNGVSVRIKALLVRSSPRKWRNTRVAPQIHLLLR